MKTTKPSSKKEPKTFTLTQSQFSDLDQVRLKLHALERIIRNTIRQREDDSSLTEEHCGLLDLIANGIAGAHDLVDKTVYFMMTGETGDEESGAR
jgi:hypothetical protein